MKLVKKVLSLFLAVFFLFSTACGTSVPGKVDQPGIAVPSGVQDLMADVPPGSTPDIGIPNEPFESGVADYSVKLFQQALSAEPSDKNLVLSPLSVLYALGMAANGADNETRSQMERLLSDGTLNVNSLNVGIRGLTERLQREGDAVMKIGNSIWFDGGKSLSVNQAFLQTNADYFGAQAYQADFRSPETVERINQWVDQQTDGKISRIIDRLDESAMLCLINTMLFSSEWESVYREHQVQDGAFHAPDGEVQVKYMHSTEQWIHDDTAQGVVKPFADDRFAFAAIVPDDEDVGAYVQSLTGETLRNLLSSTSESYPDGYAQAALPKFRFAYDTELSPALQSMGLQDGFDPAKADFSPMGTVEGGNLYIGQVLHKSFIEVDELGAKAGAATAVIMDAGGAAPAMREINFDRPFVCVIYDTASRLPLFLGVVKNPSTEDEEEPQAELSAEDAEALAIYQAVFDWLVEQDPALSDGELTAIDGSTLEHLSDAGKEAFLQYVQKTRGGTVRYATRNQLEEEGLLEPDKGIKDGCHIKLSYEKQDDGSVHFTADLYSSPLGAIGTDEGILQNRSGEWVVGEDFPIWIS
ncbi:serpin family protein [Clostridium sp. D33t1_170424_F3]|uniref:serpin family protein n=1 Tax=Clostridium sp. D33t1_170424_F3 TaxID=2787099 RepID=UPI0018AAD807|nr:serpin family protein [Clostridium sp. D33t1_170424_F3]